LSAPEKKLYLVRLAREVRQETEVAVWAESREDAEWQISEGVVTQSTRWRDQEPTMPWVIEIEENL
jgi:hypothetical protein